MSDGTKGTFTSDPAGTGATTDVKSTKKLSRRTLLKGAAAVAGAAVGSDAIRGFPTIWAQEIKDIELRHVGVSYSVVKAIGDQAAKDLGFKVTMQNLDTSAAINRFISQPNTVDIADLEGWQAKLAAKRAVIQGIEVKKIKEFDNILPSSPRARSTATRSRARASRPMKPCTLPSSMRPI